MLSLFSRVFCATLWTVASQVPLSMGFCKQGCWSGLPCPPPGDLSGPGIKPVSLMSPALAGRFFTTSTWGVCLYIWVLVYMVEYEFWYVFKWCLWDWEVMGIWGYVCVFGVYTWICGSISVFMGVWMHKQILKMKIRSQNTVVIIIAIAEFVVVQPSSPVRLFCDPMGCRTSGFPVLHRLLELAQTHVYWVGDAIQPSHPLLSPSPPSNLSQHQGLFSWVRSSHKVARGWTFSFSISPSNEYSGWFPLGWTDLFLQSYSWISRINFINCIFLQ